MRTRHLSPCRWTSSHTGRRHSTDAGRCTPPRSSSHLRRLIGERTRELDRSGPGWVLVVGEEIDRIRAELRIAIRNMDGIRGAIGRAAPVMRRAA